MKKIENIFGNPNKINKKIRKISLMFSVFLLFIGMICSYFFNIDIFQFIDEQVLHQTKGVGVSLQKCIDGDTARFLIDGNEQKIRFSGVNTPEYSNSKKEFYGKEAADFTCTKLQQATTLTIEWDTTQKASYGREIGIIFTDNQNLNLLLVQEGYADLRYLKDTMPYAKEYKKALADAQKNKRGLWQNRIT